MEEVRAAMKTDGVTTLDEALLDKVAKLATRAMKKAQGWLEERSESGAEVPEARLRRELIALRNEPEFEAGEERRVKFIEGDEGLVQATACAALASYVANKYFPRATQTMVALLGILGGGTATSPAVSSVASA